MAGIYIHIPFCKQACSYCDFHFSTQLKRKGDIIDAILLEAQLRKEYLEEETIQSIYLGGGTPSLLSEKELNLLFDHLYKHFSIASTAEVTLEANPDDLNKEKLLALSKTPVNRLSIGVQSFFDEDLQFMNRAHNSKEAVNAVLLAQDAGFHQLNIDLIFGSPSTTHAMWEENLKRFFELSIPHLSAYSLTIEEKTALAHRLASGQMQAPDDEKNLEQYLLLQQAIKEKGFIQYELSNYCENEQYSRHNTSYWKGRKYLGLGPSAHSFDGNSRQWNVNNNIQYLHAIQQNRPYFERELLSETDRYHELLITSLRTIWGLDLKAFRQEFSPEIQKHLAKQVTLLKPEQISLSTDHLTVKPTFLFQSDEIVRSLMI
jgi:oxygen-independent coproporphyrinogen-3 oxidase